MPVPHISRRQGIRTAAAAALAAPLGGVAAPAHAAVGPAVDRRSTGKRADAGEDRELRVMTFNLRNASSTEPPNTWADRRPVTRALLTAEEPHVLGTQEGLYGQLRDIAADLPARYDWIGTGRDGGSQGEFMAVFYDTDRLAPVEYDHFWLSDEPALIGSSTWGNSNVRMVTWVRFRDSVTGVEFYHLNTHLDHEVPTARERSVALITERLRGLEDGLPRVVTGDFNVPAHGDAIYDDLLGGASLLDAWDTAGERSKLYATFHGYEPLVPDGERIDWLLTSQGVRTRRASINTFSLDGQFPSDHLPVQAELELWGVSAK